MKQYLDNLFCFLRHGDLSRPQSGPQGRLASEQLWCNLTTLLNSVGGGVQKVPAKWKKVIV